MRYVIVFAIAVGALFAARPASAQPQIPSAFYGTVVVDGQPIPAGTEIRAFIGSVDCTQGDAQGKNPSFLDGSLSLYAIIVMHSSQKEGCGATGSTVTFTVGGRATTQTARWRDSFFGPAQELNLSVGQGSPVPLPTATPAPTLAPTQVAATSTARAAFTPLPATALPTDDVTITTGGTRPTGTTAPGSVIGEGASSTPPDGDDGGFPVLAAVLIVLGGVVLTGGAAGYALSKRGKKPGEPPPDA